MVSVGGLPTSGFTKRAKTPDFTGRKRRGEQKEQKLTVSEKLVEQLRTKALSKEAPKHQRSMKAAVLQAARTAQYNATVTHHVGRSPLVKALGERSTGTRKVDEISSSRSERPQPVTAKPRYVSDMFRN